MKTIEFTVTSTPDGQIRVPDDIAKQVPPGEQLQVVLLWGPHDSEDDWRAAGQRRFESAYAPEDEIYEQLAADAPVR